MSTGDCLVTFRTHPLSRFLDKYRCSSTQGSEASMTGMKSLPGKWLIPDEKYSEYLDLLHDYLFVAKARPINLVEQPRLDKAKPILIDLDFKFPIDAGLNHRFTDKNIREFVRCVTKGLDLFFNTEQYEAIRFFISLRPQAYADGVKYVKDGIHIQCPDICLTNDKQRVLRSWLLEEKAIQRSFGDIGFGNTVDDIYDESITRKQGWFFYGESKQSIPPYSLTNVLAYNPESGGMEDIPTEQFESRELMELLSVRYNLATDENEVRPQQKAMFERHLKPKVKASPAATPAPAPTPAPADSVGGAGAGAKPIGLYIPDSYDGEEIELSKQIALQCLSVERAEAYKTWMEVGWALYNIDRSEGMFNTWVEFSKKSPKATGTDWGRLKRDWFAGFSRNTIGAKLTMKSLHYWAREDNIELYKALIEEDYVRYVQYRTDDTHYHIAKLLRRMYKGTYCASIESRRTEWYVFDERIHTWRHTNQGMELREKLSTEVVDLVVRARMRLKKKCWDDHCERKNVGGEDTMPEDDWFKKWAMTTEGERFSMLSKVEKHLYTSEFKNCVMKEAAELFCEEDFTNRLNMNQHLFACRNGVLDLHNEIRDSATGKTRISVVFRDGRPDDYVSFLAGRNLPDSEAIDYIKYDPDAPEQKELMEFIAKIFPSEEMRNYFIRLMASCLEGANREQCYYTFIGVGGNGKSKLVDLMRYTFGDYCSSLQATALTRKRPDSGSANPDIIAIKNKRFIYLQEPDDKEPLNTSRMKQFSGEDVVEARGLFEDQQRFRITGKLFMMCNRLPPITAMDRGTWRRIRVLLFGSKFVDSSDPELKVKKANVFLRDNDTDAKLRLWREAWLGLLVHVYESQYLVNGLEPVPEIVMGESNKYKESFDQYGKFKAERMVDFRNPRLGLAEYGDEQMTLRDAQLAYTNWIRQNEGLLSGTRLKKQELQNRLDEDFGQAENGVYKRVVVFFDDEGKADYEKSRSGETAIVSDD